MTGLMTGLMTGEMTSQMAGLMTGMMTSEKTGAQPGKQQHRLLVKRMPILVGLHLACRPVAEIRCPACRPDLTDRCSGCRPGLPGVLQKRINTLPVVMAFAHFLSPLPDAAPPGRAPRWNRLLGNRLGLFLPEPSDPPPWGTIRLGSALISAVCFFVQDMIARQNPPCKMVVVRALGTLRALTVGAPRAVAVMIPRIPPAWRARPVRRCAASGERAKATG